MIATGVATVPPVNRLAGRHVDDAVRSSLWFPALAAFAVLACGPSERPVDAAVAQAIAVWEHGSKALEPETDTLGRFLRAGASMPEEQEPFVDFNGGVRSFLRSPRVRHAVQFGCVGLSYPVEDAVTAALDANDPIVRLRALIVLVRVRAPSSVEAQWRVLQDLRGVPREAGFGPLLDQIADEFTPKAIDRLLTTPQMNTELQWAARAAGVTGHRGALARLIQLSTSEHTAISLAAGRSLEDFGGLEGDEALAACVRGWRYMAATHACVALRKRNPELLRATLLAMAPTERDYVRGLHLARLDDPQAVPILCAEVPKVAIVDREMFEAIARLAGAEHLAAVEQLPERVRPEQLARARNVVAEVRGRLRR